MRNPTIHHPPITIHAPLQRLPWIDFLRGLAVLGMIEAHSVNNFLHPDYRSGPWFAALSYLNGWVAPTFLFIAGLLQGASIRKNGSAKKPIGPRLRSLGLILLIGYGLQFPWDALSQLGQPGWQQILRALGRIDVLHCLAVSLTFLLLLSRVVRKPRHYDLVVLTITLVFLLTSVTVWKTLAALSTTSSSFPGNPLFGYLSPARGALFPFFPWFIYVAAGTLASRLLTSSAQSLGNTAATPRPGSTTFPSIWQKMSFDTFHLSPFTLPILLTAAFGWLLRFLFHDTLATLTYSVRPDAILFRLSLVLLSAALCAHIIRPTSTGTHRSLTFAFGLTRAINWAGARSLPLYVFHLILLHSGLGFLPPLARLFSRTQTPLATFALYLLTLIGTLLLTHLWQKLNSWRSQPPG